MNDLLTLFKKYKGNAKDLIETGTYNGVGVRTALKAGFEGIISFEISKDLVDAANKTFQDKPCVTIHNESSSGKTFKLICEALVGPCVFWLDAHRMGVGGKIPDDYPLIEELRAISKSTLSHTVLMDDFRLFERYGVTIEDVIELLSKDGVNYRLVKDTVRDKYTADVLCFIPEVKK